MLLMPRSKRKLKKVKALIRGRDVTAEPNSTEGNYSLPREGSKRQRLLEKEGCESREISFLRGEKEDSVSEGGRRKNKKMKRGGPPECLGRNKSL